MGSNQSSLDGKYVNMIRDQFNKLKDGDKNYLVFNIFVYCLGIRTNSEIESSISISIRFHRCFCYFFI